VVVGQRGPQSAWSRMSRVERDEYERKRLWCLAVWESGSMPFGSSKRLNEQLGHSATRSRDILQRRVVHPPDLERIHRFIVTVTGRSMRPGTLGVLDTCEVKVKAAQNALILAKEDVVKAQQKQHEAQAALNQAERELERAKEQLAREEGVDMDDYSIESLGSPEEQLKKMAEFEAYAKKEGNTRIS
jgi:hypothetical protein